MKRTTILADEELLCEAKELAAEQGITFTALVQQALRNYLAIYRLPRHISFAGIGRSGGSSTPEEMDEILIAGLDPIEEGPCGRAYGGWVPEEPDRACAGGARILPRTPGREGMAPATAGLDPRARSAGQT